MVRLLGYPLLQNGYKGRLRTLLRATTNPPLLLTPSHVKDIPKLRMASSCSSKVADAQVSGAPKYCATCGRLISANHRNFAERKYCSKSCSSSKPSGLDREIENYFRKCAIEGKQVSCEEVQQYFESTGTAPTFSRVDRQRAGLDVAKFRERVRRAGRRVVAFPDEPNGRFECVQKGKPVEASYAKGEWAVRWTKEQPT